MASATMPPWPGDAEVLVGDALLVERALRYRVARSTEGALDIDLAAAGRFRLDSAAREAWILRAPEAEVDLASLVCGPVMLLALAARACYALHAAALRWRGQALLVLADSGVGKSTLARVAQALGHERLADDVAIVSMPAGRPQLRLPYPQLKLEPCLAPGATSATLPIGALVFLSRRPDCARQGLTPAATLRRLLAHSIAARLYPAAWQAAHLHSLAQAAEALAGRSHACAMREDRQDPDAAARALLRELDTLP